MNLEEIRALIKMLHETDISELSLETNEIKIHINKGHGSGGMIEKPVKNAAKGSNVSEQYLSNSTDNLEKNIDKHHEQELALAGLVPVAAPMVGTFYLAPAPDAPPFAGPGDTVKEGQTVCIIEAMKLMNEIEAEVAGEIVDVLVQNGEPVEYGQSLFLIKPSK